MWDEVYADIRNKIGELSQLGRNRLFFRGQSDSDWLLLPALARERLKNVDLVEHRLFFDFTVRAGTLLPASNNAWTTIFAMQHHGIPTRLLDWTETFAVALYFAIKGATKDAAIWMLQPWRLNKNTIDRQAILEPTELAADYLYYYGEPRRPLPGNVIALSPLRQNPRISQQRSGFTLHDDLDNPLEVLHPDVAVKIVVPRACHRAARQFLTLAGVSEFTLFPDLDGLARELTELHVTHEPRAPRPNSA